MASHMTPNCLLIGPFQIPDPQAENVGQHKVTTTKCSLMHQQWNAFRCQCYFRLFMAKCINDHGINARHTLCDES